MHASANWNGALLARAPTAVRKGAVLRAYKVAAHLLRSRSAGFRHAGHRLLLHPVHERVMTSILLTLAVYERSFDFRGAFTFAEEVRWHSSALELYFGRVHPNLSGANCVVATAAPRCSRRRSISRSGSLFQGLPNQNAAADTSAGRLLRAERLCGHPVGLWGC